METLLPGRADRADRAAVPTGRIDRKIEFPLPDEKTKKRIFQIHTSRMTLADDVTLDDLIMAKDDLSGADIKVRPGTGRCHTGLPLHPQNQWLFEDIPYSHRDEPRTLASSAKRAQVGQSACWGHRLGSSTTAHC